MAYHVPVLLNECIEGLSINPNGIYLDMTFGGGGHSREIVKHLSSKGKLIAFDQDEAAFANTINDKRFMLIHSNFRFFVNFLNYHKVERVDGILADLGVSSHHFDNPERGFSFRFSGPLDMRMNQNAPLSAKQVVNDYTEEQLVQIMALYGEVPNARRVVKAIISQRGKSPISTIEQLVEAIDPLFPAKVKNKMMAMVFQALRIEVNGEIEALKNMLLQAEKVLQPKGRLVVISYHSLEDRLVKNFFRAGDFSGKVEKDFYGNINSPFNIINRKVIVPTVEELEQNSRARSAKLRIAEKR